VAAGTNALAPESVSVLTAKCRIGWLLAFSGPLRRSVHRITVPTDLFLCDGLDGVTCGPAAMRRLFLMRGMLVIVRLEMLGLVLGTFAILGHEFLQLISRHFIWSICDFERIRLGSLAAITRRHGRTISAVQNGR